MKTKVRWSILHSYFRNIIPLHISSDRGLTHLEPQRAICYLLLNKGTYDQLQQFPTQTEHTVQQVSKLSRACLNKFPLRVKNRLLCNSHRKGRRFPRGPRCLRACRSTRGKILVCWRKILPPTWNRSRSCIKHRQLRRECISCWCKGLFPIVQQIAFSKK